MPDDVQAGICGTARRVRIDTAQQRCRREVPRSISVGGCTVACHAIEEGRLAAYVPGESAREG